MTVNRSKPRYTPLVPDFGGRYHLLFGQGSGGEVLLRLAAKLAPVGPIHLIYAAESTHERNWSDDLRAIGAVDSCFTPTPVEAIVELDRSLAKCSMGTRLYIVGPESFIGAAMQVVQLYNMNSDEVQAEHCGSAARRVYCVHCRTSQENVTTNIVKCSGCGVWLLVRDHYSRRVAAYMGAKADAEAPGNLPLLRTLYE